ncbi:conserved oligomeric Golgi complex subunit 8 isoform X1 [Octopus sinensis]|uniref:Conserved oligomeric Golgi complex subunit 8 n=1 Tax=Octopus sinensis TaxID=2607531 RepID=A0A7E6FHQ2_9MOLL|nr:conserved oligomeric Golgi complex subunit 8 isoform X1 [Octopus sinensis]
MSTVDVEDETILTAIFKDSFPESWKENPDFVQYLAELSSFGIEKLSREPERLAEEKAQILEETQDLAFHNYKTFIETAECSREIFEDFQIIEKHVSNLLQQLPPFSSECENIAKRAQEINASRRMNSLTLQRHTQLLEILEMPQLMDTCVRNGYYEEALELTAHVKRLEKKHYNLPVIASIVDEVKGSTQLMLNQLIQQLRTNIQLPLCLRVIGYLRRMDVFSEAELRIKFLQARDAWFQCIIDGIPTDDAYVHITKIIEASRVHLFDIITQYRAIFSDDDTLMTSSSAAAAPRDDLLQHSSPFYSWLTLKVNQFLSTLESDLSKGVGGRLDSLVGQCMYFSLSFSRIGADFRSLLVPIFYSAALNSFQTTLNNANKKFSEMMQSYNLMGLTFTGGLAYNMSTQPGQLYPPSVLLDFQPLANYCNHVLTAFNDLRLCLPISLACDITDKLEKSLLKVNDVILSFHRAEESTLSNTETDHFQHLLQVYTNHFLPYVQKCMLTLFPPSHLAQTLGLTIVDLTSMGNPGSLNIELIQAGVSHLLPEKEDDVMETAAMEMNLPPLEDTNVEASQQNAREVENAVTKRELSPEMSSATAPGETLNTSAASTSEDALISPASVTETTPVIPASVPESTTETSASVPKITPVTPTFVPGATPVMSASVPEATPVMSASVPEATPVMPASVPEATPVTPATPKTPAFVPEATPDIPAFVPEATPHIPAFVPEATPHIPAFVPEATPDIPAFVPEATPDIPAFVPEATPHIPAFVPEATPHIPAFVPEATPHIPAFVPEATPHIPAFVPEATPKTLAFVPETSPVTASPFPEATTDVSPTSISNIAFPMDPTRVNLSSLPLSQVVPQDNDPNMIFTTESLDRIDLDDIKLDEASATN